MENLDVHIQFLESITRDLDEYSARNGRNKSIRNRESNKITEAVSLLEYYLGNNSDLASLLLKYHNGSSFGYEETVSFKYIIRDVPRFIDFLRSKDVDSD